MGEEALGASTPCLFELTCLVSASNVCLSARCTLGQRQLIALVMRSGDLTLYYQRGQSGQLPVMKHIPWFVDSNKKIVALCFNPSGNWLVAVAYDGSIFIVPVLSLVDPSAVLDHQWLTSDLTSFPSPSVMGSSRRGRPTAVAWWQGIREYQHVVIVGTDQGELSFFSLTGGTQVGTTHVDGAIEMLHICEDNSLDSMYLLITSRQRSQWKLLLEQSAAKYCWPLEGSPGPWPVHPGALESSSGSHTSSTDVDTGKNSTGPHLPTARLRLQGLKQLSVEKLAHLKLKLAETRLRNTNNFHVQREASGENRDDVKPGEAVEPQLHLPSSGPLPERVNAHVGGTFLCPQYARDRYLLSSYYGPSSILTIHSISVEDVPLFVYKLPPDCRDILVTDRFLFITDSREQAVSIVSCHFAENHFDFDIDNEFNMDSMVGKFEFGENERVLALYKQGSAMRPQQSHVHNLVKEGLGEVRSRSHKKSSLQYVPPKDPAELKVDSPPVDSCVVVTTHGIYQLALRQPAAEVFMDLVLNQEQLETAGRVALMFGLPRKELLEHAGDLKLATKDFAQAIELYKLSRCSHLKIALKLAAGGHSTELLVFIRLLFSSAWQDLTVAHRIHLSNLAVMSHTEQLLRAALSKAAPFKQFLKFLQENAFYDEVLAVNVAGQTGLWEVLQFLAGHRGLQQEVLEIAATVMRSLVDGLADPPDKGSSLQLAPLLDVGLWMCVSDPMLLPALLARPQHCKVHLKFVTSCLPHLERFALQRLAALYDPSSPLLRPNVRRLLGSQRTHQCSSSYSYFSDGTLPGGGAVGGTDEAGVLLEDMIQKFLLVLLHLAKKLAGTHVFFPCLMPHVLPPRLIRQDMDDSSPMAVPVQVMPLSAGFGHVALVRNGTAHTWGSAAQGCLGTGPTLSQYSSAQPVTFFPSLKLEVLSVSCGRLHTIALTDNGVFTWGSSQYGQLGVGRTGRSSRPHLVDVLCRERIVAVSAGQYHCLALTNDGRVYSWGWGVHGQLGHGSIEDLHIPAPIHALSGKVVVQVCGGYAHSLVLTADGRVFSFGSSMFGQLGHGSTTKSSVPVLVTMLHESIRLIATGYFHNLAVSLSNKLYVWGSSPQVLRVQAQAQKKARLLQHQLFMYLNGPDLAGVKSPAHRPRLGAVEDDTPTTDFSSAINYSDSEFEVIGDGSVSDAPVSDVPCGCENGYKQPPTSEKPTEAVVKNCDHTADEIILPFPQESDMLDAFKDSENIFGSLELPADVTTSQRTICSEDASAPAGCQNRHIEKTEIMSRNCDLLEGPPVSSTPQRILGGNGIPNLPSLEVMKGPDIRSNLHLKAVLSGVVSAEDYVMQSVVSPTMEFKGLTATPNTLTTDSNSFKAGNDSPHQSQPDGPEDGQSHLVPQLVDTSRVTGEIVQVSCGCHHSALLSEDILYMWGRNLDGQVGNGTRKEVPLPTPLSLATAHRPPGSIRYEDICKLNISGVIPGGSDQLRIQQVCCGCEFTVALDHSSKVWAWGSNANGQLGKPPNEDARGLEGKLFMQKSTKRVIKLPHGSSNSSDTPKEVLGIPSSTISFKYGVFSNNTQVAELSNDCLPLSTLEKPSYGLVTLHYVLQQFHGFYNSSFILNKCIELENYQTAAKLAALDRNYPIALSHQLKALALAIPESILRSDQRASDEQLSEKENCSEDQPVDGRTLLGDKEKSISSPIVNNSSLKIGHDAASVKEYKKIDCLEENIVNGDATVIITTSCGICSLNSTGKLDNLEKCSHDAECVSEKSATYNISPEKCVNGVENDEQPEFLERESKCKTTDRLERKATVGSADSCQDEMHTFAVEGGKEQLFEVGQCLSSPDSASSLVNMPMSTVDSDGTLLQSRPDPRQKRDSLPIDKPGQEPTDLRHGNGNKSSRRSLKLELRNPAGTVDIVENHAGGGSPRGDILDHLHAPKHACSDQPLSASLSASTPRTSGEEVSLRTFTNLSSETVSACASPLDMDRFLGPAKECITPVQLTVTNYKDLMQQASSIVEYYVSIMEEDSHAMMNQLLNKGIEFWLQHSLPMDTLEALLLKHMSKFYYPLGLLVFCQRPGCRSKEAGDEHVAAVLSHLSSRFTVQLCSTLLSHLQNRKQCPEYVEVLARCSAMGSNTSEDNSQEQMMEEVFQNLGTYAQPGQQSAQQCIRFKDMPTLKQGREMVEQVFVFSCGHHHTGDSLRHELEVGLLGLERPLPNTARMLKEVFSTESPSLHLACPSCVLAYLHSAPPP